METLCEMATEAVAGELNNSEAIEELEVPKCIKENLWASCQSQWTKRWQRMALEKNRLK